MSYEISPHKTFLAATVKLNVIKQMACELGFDV